MSKIEKIILGIATTALVVAFGVAMFGGKIIEGAIEGAIERVIERVIESLPVGGISNYDSLTLGDDLIVNKTSTLTGTSTVTQSVDGLIIGGTVSTSATGTALTAYTNTTGPKMCDASTGYLFVRNASYAPSTVWSVGTSTSAVTTINLLASSTIATTTTGLIPLTGSLFELLQGDELMVIFAEHDPTASSTNLGGNTGAEVGVWCQDISI